MKKLLIIVILFVAAIVPMDNIRAGERTAAFAPFSVTAVNNSSVYSVVELYEYITPFTPVMVMRETILPGVAPVNFGPFNTGTYDVKIIVYATGSHNIGFNQFTSTVTGSSSGTVTTFPGVSVTGNSYTYVN
ncbi:hypothetical protein GFS24_08740 [Chitinophaga sp. SYP-B3965]|uniref:hypothetical protein n=1 Tax=Chitinophaga sp. SYP-B3965 TaxID=2663120 RepID=UPI00129975F9|nr:hypothetical protein [Chitinophaga sp. SYP-B3965]MRG45200.1 hypothetical protein [Chitinophaga sp. SYP-B3965]